VHDRDPTGLADQTIEVEPIGGFGFRELSGKYGLYVLSQSGILFEGEGQFFVDLPFMILDLEADDGFLRLRLVWFAFYGADDRVVRGLLKDAAVFLL
jgi:hypothetical protein